MKKKLLLSLIALAGAAFAAFMLWPLPLADFIEEDTDLVVYINDMWLDGSGYIIVDGRVYRQGYWGNGKALQMMREMRAIIEDHATGGTL